MTILINFQEYTPTEEDKVKLQDEVGVIFLKCDQGVDWYDSFSAFDANKLKIVFDTKTGVIVQTGVDITALWPNGYSIADVENEINVKPDDLKGKVFNIRAGKIVDRVYTKAEQKLIADSKISSLQKEASNLMAPLQAAKELDMMTEEESAYLKELQRYLVYLNRVTSQEGYPTNIEWPILPTK
jgi:hypothetical protein